MKEKSCKNSIFSFFNFISLFLSSFFLSSSLYFFLFDFSIHMHARYEIIMTLTIQLFEFFRFFLLSFFLQCIFLSFFSSSLLQFFFRLMTQWSSYHQKPQQKKMEMKERERKRKRKKSEKKEEREERIVWYMQHMHKYNMNIYHGKKFYSFILTEFSSFFLFFFRLLYFPLALREKSMERKREEERERKKWNERNGIEWNSWWSSTSMILLMTISLERERKREREKERERESRERKKRERKKGKERKRKNSTLENNVCGFFDFSKKYFIPSFFFSFFSFFLSFSFIFCFSISSSSSSLFLSKSWLLCPSKVGGWRKRKVTGYDSSPSLSFSFFLSLFFSLSLSLSLSLRSCPFKIVRAEKISSYSSTSCFYSFFFFFLLSLFSPLFLHFSLKKDSEEWYGREE